MGESNIKKGGNSQNPPNSDEWIGNSEKELLDLVVDLITELILKDEGKK